MLPVSLTQLIRNKAFELGFDQFGICKAQLSPEKAQQLNEFIDRKRHGEMQWLEDRSFQRSSPDHLWPEVKSAIVLGVNYGPNIDPLANLNHPEIGNISVYARHRDYHDMIKGWLKHLAQYIIKEAKPFITPTDQVKVFVDTAPIMEKPLAQQAGLGWQGKHTNLVSRQFGSWLFLGEILTTLELPPSQTSKNHCGSCNQCLQACPTNAFPAPFQLDATRCISYLTIEYSGAIPIEFRKSIGNRIYGCDDCLAVCPWNHFAQHSRHIKLQARQELNKPLLKEFSHFTEEEFRQFFSGSPVKRIGYIRFIRNVLIALGNSQQQSLLCHAQLWANHDNAIIQETAQWAIEQLKS
ncbi:Epoxyqueuosine reductase QueG (queuosine biosynthesis) (QueG) (PDB:5D08) (PUBMED:2150253) [Commensalibacter communis]|uniref:tRNA epoxyqueuosine(34) reductase QueG n=1 Tax=Commensalibacter communis TaxID=2972786 RepID=UPI0022FF7BF5|nr:tRNA epoxyqueuosine(34) reductase QueG [Commensalibacter communis]CAI3933156.1 Epoxyqueuosine reductase QueG (queuosine biosynthesis) (QueG) (PDB:5D08) (PUBMED:2150253) [Commensalibacter communis]CAI3945262.1 Epoxyqueuosine reductase QueG (queuosine biosynthesis) (QueG) (PDB:5D08) (PUBMED:2150253) [Commensalibacter communis]CAI3945448.1 Epoxyqueuosine reductase QueG (queuosine biosynthesis) (QueG) (PDB:5D08) (PUBMED:2150253) [Commensalibacter communis]